MTTKKNKQCGENEEDQPEEKKCVAIKLLLLQFKSQHKHVRSKFQSKLHYKTGKPLAHQHTSLYLEFFGTAKNSRNGVENETGLLYYIITYTCTICKNSSIGLNLCANGRLK